MVNRLNFLELYRMIPGIKTSSARLLLWALFGLAAAGVFDLKLYILDFLFVLFFMMSISFFNDYYDWKLLGEENASSKKNVQSIVPGLAPLACALVFLFLVIAQRPTLVSMAALFYSIIGGFAYSVPPVRMKDKKVFNIAIPATGMFCLFFQGFTLLTLPDARGFFVAFTVFLFAWYTELLHIVDDSFYAHETFRVKRKTAVFLLKQISVLGAFTALVGAFFNIIFLVSVLAWSARFWAIKNTLPVDFAKARRNFLHPVWQLYDFALYGLAGIATALGISIL